MFLSHQASGHKHIHTVYVAGTWWMSNANSTTLLCYKKWPPLRITCRGPQRVCSLDLSQQPGKEKKETVIWTVFLPFSFGISYDRPTLLDMEKIQCRLTFSFPGLPTETQKSFWGTASCTANVLIKLTPCAKHPACQCLLTWKQAGRAKSQEQISGKPGRDRCTFIFTENWLSKTQLWHCTAAESTAPL